MKRKFLIVVVSVLALASTASAVIVDGSLVTHLEGDSLGLADGVPVATWTDLSPGGLGDATQPTAGIQPTYVIDPGTFNGHNSVQFDGTDDWMDMVDLVDVSEFTLFLVGKFNATGTDQYFVSGQPGAGDTRLRIAEYGWSGYFRYRAGDSDYSSFDVAVMKDLEAHVFAIDDVSNGWLDKAALANPHGNTKSGTAALAMGAYYGGADPTPAYRNFLNGEIAEIVLYNRTLSTAEVEQINAELYAKYVPEPATMVLLGLGAVLLRRRK